MENRSAWLIEQGKLEIQDYGCGFDSRLRRGIGQHVRCFVGQVVAFHLVFLP